MLYTYRCSSTIGELTISSNGTEIAGQKYLSTPSPENYEEKDLPVMSPLLPEGTPFRKKVWELLLKIPYGQTIPYGELAEKMAKLQGIIQLQLLFPVTG